MLTLEPKCGVGVRPQVMRKRDTVVVVLQQGMPRQYDDYQASIAFIKVLLLLLSLALSLSSQDSPLPPNPPPDQALVGASGASGCGPLAVEPMMWRLPHARITVMSVQCSKRCCMCNVRRGDGAAWFGCRPRWRCAR